MGLVCREDQCGPDASVRGLTVFSFTWYLWALLDMKEDMMDKRGLSIIFLGPCHTETGIQHGDECLLLFSAVLPQLEITKTTGAAEV